MTDLKTRSSKATPKKGKQTTSFYGGVSPLSYDNGYSKRGESKKDFDLLRSLSYANNVARICIQIIKDTVLQTPYTITTKEGYESKDFEGEIKYLEDLLRKPNNNNDTFRTLFSTVIEDIKSIDRGVIEKVRNSLGEVVELYPVDGATIFTQVDDYGMMESPAYKQFLAADGSKGKPDALFEQDDLMLFIANPQQGKLTGYGRSPVSSIIESIVTWIQQNNFNASYFTSAKTPPALINLPGADKEGLQSLKEGFEAQLRRGDHPLVWTNADDMKFTLVRPSNQDMQFVELYEKLTQMVVSGFGLSIQDVGLIADVNRATAEVQANASKNRGVRSTMNVIAEEINIALIDDLAEYHTKFGALQFKYLEIDKIDEKTEAEINKIYIESGVVSINEVREKLGYKELEDDILNVNERLEEITKSVNKQKSNRLEKAVMDFGDDEERKSMAFEDKVNFDEIGRIIDENSGSILKVIEGAIFANAERVKQTIIDAVEANNPKAAASLTAISAGEFIFAVRDVSNKTVNEALDEALTEVPGVAVQPNIDKLLEVSEVEAEINSSDVANKLNTNIRNLAATAIVAGYTVGRIRSAVDEVNRKFINTTVKSMSSSLTLDNIKQVRKYTFDVQPDIIGYGYSAMLDSKTTRYCRSMDGTQYELDSPALPGITPPNHFNCRSILVPIFASEEFSPDSRIPRGVDTLPTFENKDAFE